MILDDAIATRLAGLLETIGTGRTGPVPNACRASGRILGK
jgi:hypothetical protein